MKKLTIRRKWLLAVVLLLLLCYLGRVYWVNASFRTEYGEKEVAVGERFEESELEICVESVVRSGKTEDAFTVTAKLSIQNLSEETMIFMPHSVYICSAWFCEALDAAATAEENGWDDYDGIMRINPQEEIAVYLVFSIGSDLMEQSWDQWESVPLYLSFINTNIWKKVYVP